MTNFSIEKRSIGTDYKPYFIAEMSCNHNQSLENALNIVKIAKNFGADAVKIQTFSADSMTINSNKDDFIIDDRNSLWFGRNLYDLYSEAQINWDWVKKIFDLSKELDIQCFSSVFDEKSLDFLEDLNTPAYKIASFENNHLPLIKNVCSTHKPVIISTGGCTEDEIDEIVENAREAGCRELAILKCTSDYPADVQDVNLLTIPYMRKKFGCEIGLSDHTKGIGTSIGAIAHGASIIEKHFLPKYIKKSLDSGFSINEEIFGLLIKEGINAWKSLGKINFELSRSEINNLKFKRSIYACAKIEIGEVFTNSNIKIIRPGMGAKPKNFDKLIGKKSNKKYEVGDPIN